MIRGRALHFVFKTPDRKKTIEFYTKILGMKILRHEEFSEGCDAACNGPYNNRWSKTMCGYGPEHTHFAIELTYNYGIKDYKMGNDFLGITIKSSEAIENAKKYGWKITENNILEAPGGYKFFLLDETSPKNTDPVVKVTLASSNIKRTHQYWNSILNLKVFQFDDKTLQVGFSDNQAILEFVDIGTSVNHEQAYGRIAFSVPFEEQSVINKKITEAGEKILTPLISLDTPGKATVRVIILADPDGHEICFVDDEGFRQLSEVDPDSEKLLTRYMAKE